MSNASSGYRLAPEHLVRAASRPTHFRRDSELSGPAATNADYTGSGYSRGHLAPAADFAWSNEAIRATFVLSNAIPQKQRVNAGIWAWLEAAVRRIAATAGEVYVFTGALFSADPETIGAGRVAVPSHTFKVVLVIDGERKSMFAAVVPNAENVTGPLDRFLVGVDEIERFTGLDFFAALDDAEEEQLESRPSPVPAMGHSQN